VNAIRITVLSVVAGLLLGGLGACSGRYDLSVAMDVCVRSRQARPVARPAARRGRFASHHNPADAKARPAPVRPVAPSDVPGPTARRPAPPTPGDPLRLFPPAAFSTSPPASARSDARSRRSESSPVFAPASIPYPPAARNHSSRPAAGFSTLLKKVAAAGSADQSAPQRTLSPSRIFRPPAASPARPIRPPTPFPLRPPSPPAAPGSATAVLRTERPTAAAVRVVPPARESADRDRSDRRDGRR